ncbi:MAG: hypothetical protein U0360_00620 [Dehalococcoidia bacterium]
MRSTSAPEGTPVEAAIEAARASASGTDRRTVELDGERYRVQTTVLTAGRLGALAGLGGARGPGGPGGANGNGGSRVASDRGRPARS